MCLFEEIEDCISRDAIHLLDEIVERETFVVKVMLRGEIPLRRMKILLVKQRFFK